MNSSSRMALAASAAWTALTLGGAAWAAEAPDQTATAKELGPLASEVVVTARRRAEAIESVPISISAISGDQLKAQGVTVTNELQFSVPGVTFTGVAGTRENPPISLRGQGQTFGGALPGVQSYFNEIPTPGSMSTLYDMESVQVLKGPQGTLFGRNTTGGAILYTPRRPQPEFGGYITARAGNLDYREVEAAINIPLGDKAALRISGDMLRREGYTRDLATGKDLDDQHRDDWRVSLALKPWDNVTSDFVATGLRVRQNGGSEILYSAPSTGLLSTPFFAGLSVPGYFQQQLVNGNRSTWSVTGHPNFFNRDFWLVSNITAVKFGDFELKNIIGYQETKTSSQANLAGAPTPVLYQGGASLLNPGPEKGGPAQFSDELHLTGLSFDNKLNWIVGGSYIHEKPVGKFVQTVVVLGNPFAAVQNPTMTTLDTVTKDYGVFAQGTYDLGAWLEGLKITGGYRYSVNKQSLTAVAGTQGVTNGAPNGTFVCSVPGLAANTPVAGCHTDLSAEFKAPSWTLSLDWQATPDTLVYVATRRGFKAGGFNALAVDPRAFRYGAEKLTDVEVGLKNVWRSGDFSLHSQIAAYHSDVDNVQRFAALSVIANGQPTVITVTRNVGTAKVNGIEVQATAFIGDNVELMANYAHTDASISPRAGVAGAGTTFSGVPKDAGSVTGVLRLPLGDSVGEARLSTTWYHQARTPFVDNLDTEPQAFGEAYSLMNLRAEWNRVLGSGVDLAAFVNNAANKEYVVDGVIALNSALGYSVHAFGPPRTYGVELRYHFD